MNNEINSTQLSKVAILFTEDFWTTKNQESLGTSNDLLCLLGKPMLQRVIEQVVQNGFRDVHIFLGKHPDSIRNFVKNGERWGITPKYHYANPDESLAETVARLNLEDDTKYFLTSSHVIPVMKADFFHLENDIQGRTFLFDTDQGCRWIGWGFFKGSWLKQQEATTRAIVQNITMDDRIEKIEAAKIHSVLTLKDFLKTSAILMEEQRMNQEILIGRGCQIHPSAKIVAPVHLGKRVKIGANVVIGPNVSVGDGSYIDKDTSIRDSAVMPGSYVGAGLELSQVISRGKFLANTRLEAVLEIEDDGLLSFIFKSGETRQKNNAVEINLAWLLKISLAPLYSILRISKAQAMARSYQVELTKKRMFEHCDVQRKVIPNSEIYPMGKLKFVRHFVNNFYPGLNEVIRGNLVFHGPKLRSKEEIKRLPDEWKDLYGYKKCGLLQEDLLIEGPKEAWENELSFACDSFAALNNSTRVMLRLLGRYLVLLMSEVVSSYKYPSREVEKKMGKQVPMRLIENFTRRKS